MEKLIWDRTLINRFWNGVSSSRLEELSFAKQAGKKLVEIVAEYLPLGTRCLDFGAGSGELVKVLLNHGCMVAAYEPARDRQALLLESEVGKHPNFIGITDDQSVEKFDVIFAAEVLEHVLDSELDGVINRFKELLNPQGILIVTTPNNEDLDLNSAYCPVCNSFFHRWQHVRTFSAESLSCLLESNGFKQLHDHRVDFSSAAEIYEQHIQLLREVRVMKWIGPLYYFVRPIFLRLFKHIIIKRRGPDLRQGAQNQLVYVAQFTTINCI